MEELLAFAKGPLFRFSFAIMLLGLGRLLILTVINGFEAKSKAKDKQLPEHYVRKLTIGYVLPIRSLRVKPLYSVVSILFHVGLILTPLLLFDHALLFKESIGFSWIGISLAKETADFLTILTIATAFILLIMRATSKTARFLSRAQDYWWLIILTIPFATGLVCSQTAVSPDAYNAFMLVHILSAEIIFIMIPFTKIAHCVLMPFGQWITARSWKFAPEAGEEIVASLGKEGEKL